MVHTRVAYVTVLKVGKVQNVTFLPTTVNLLIVPVEDSVWLVIAIVKLGGKDPNVTKVNRIFSFAKIYLLIQVV